MSSFLQEQAIQINLRQEQTVYLALGLTQILVRLAQ
jgi:hypothetical protein